MASLHVREGSITELRCPEPQCRAELSPAALEQILSESEYERWHRLKMQQIITAEMKGVILCPRCEGLGVETLVQAEEPQEKGEAPLATCGTCGFMFCGKCLDVYHQNLSQCTSADAMTMKRELRKDRQNMTLAQRRELQKIAKGFVVQLNPGDSRPPVDAAGFLTEDYEENGHVGDEIASIQIADPQEPSTIWARESHPLETLSKALESSLPISIRIRPPRGADRHQSRKMMEELLSLKAISANSQACPQCRITVMRSEGCNHMTCTLCRTHFCYRCGETLSPIDPYSHFKADGCPTFDRSEVERIAAQERMGRGRDLALEELRQQFGDQRHLYEQFQNQTGRQERPLTGHQAHVVNGDTQCPVTGCRQWNSRNGTLNHIRCQNCRGSYCHCCGERIIGSVPAHYRGPGACPMHGDSA